MALLDYEGTAGQSRSIITTVASATHTWIHAIASGDKRATLWASLLRTQVSSALSGILLPPGARKLQVASSLTCCGVWPLRSCSRGAKWKDLCHACHFCRLFSGRGLGSYPRGPGSGWVGGEVTHTFLLQPCPSSAYLIEFLRWEKLVLATYLLPNVRSLACTSTFEI